VQRVCLRNDDHGSNLRTFLGLTDDASASEFESLPADAYLPLDADLIRSQLRISNCSALGRASVFSTPAGRRTPSSSASSENRKGWLSEMVVRELLQRQAGLSVAKHVELEHPTLDQTSHLSTASVLGQERAPAAGVGLVHRVRQHRLHHDAFL